MLPPVPNRKHMKTPTLSVFAAVALAFTSSAFGGSSKTYQVTGPVLEANDSMIAVQKGKERWEVARDASTKVAGEVKVGEKVTVTYTMTATNVEAKAAGKKADKATASPAASASPAKK
jgi:hypothetical protein